MVYKAQFAEEKIKLREFMDKNNKEIIQMNKMIKNEMIDISDTIEFLGEKITSKGVKLDLMLEMMIQRGY